MPPPPADNFASRLFLSPALRTQSDRRLVSLVREGYENAFEEIVRRYGRPLGRFAAAIVPSHRAEDVTQDAFSKALLALRHTDKEIELKPWLYRIVRNTALNDLRDEPAPGAQLHEDIDGAETPPEAAERREEIAELLRRLQALPEPQRAAIVMRELEGLSHEEIAAALGMSGGAARQAIYRARRSLRDGAGMLIPIPLLHFLLAGAGGAAAGAGGAAAGAGAAGVAGAGGGAAIKAGLATVLVAGSVGAGVAVEESRDGGGDSDRAGAATRSGGASDGPGASPFITSGGESGSGDRRGRGRGGEREDGDDRGRNRGRGDERGEGEDGRDDGGRGPGPNSGPGGGGELEGSEDTSSGPGSGTSGGSGSSGKGDSGSGGSGSSGSGSSGSGSGSSGSSGSGGSGSGSGSGGSGSGDSGSGSSGSGGDEPPPQD